MDHPQASLNGPFSLEIVVFDLVVAFVSFALVLCSGENLKRGCSLWREKHQFYGPHPPREQLFKLFWLFLPTRKNSSGRTQAHREAEA